MRSGYDYDSRIQGRGSRHRAIRPGIDRGLTQRSCASFGNLIDNAVRYTPKGGVVNVSIRRLNGRFVVEVTDTGSGVAEADIPRLFDRFFRAAPLDVEGSGLGLAIAASVARCHGFQIEIVNGPDRQGLIARVSGSVS